MSRSRLIALLLAFGTLLVFLPVGGFNFVNFDDTDYVTENDFVKHGLTMTDIQWAFTAFHAGNWHPLTWLSHMLDCELFGPNAGAHHFVNVLWHALNVALLFTWLFRLTIRMAPAAFVAALFAWHPLHVESVAWIAERKDVLSTFFALLALLAYTKYAQDKKKEFLWLALVWFALGLMAKPMLVTLPFLLLLLDYWPLQRLAPFKSSIFVEKIPFFALSMMSCVVTFLAQQRGEAVASLHAVSLSYRLENAPVAILGYLGKLFVPVNLCALYPMPPQIPIWEVALALVVIILISALGWQWRQSRPYFLMGWLWFLGTLMPVIGLVQVGGQSMADRYTYIPSIGFFIAVVFLLAEVTAKIETPKVITVGGASTICLACILVTENQLQFWRDSEALFRRAIAVTTDNAVAYLNLGVALDVQGRFDESLPIYRQAEKLDPNRFQIHNNLGNILHKFGQPAGSLEEYRLAIQLRPNDATLHDSAALELDALAQYDDALKELDTASQLDPQDAWTHIDRAKIFFEQGLDTNALNELSAAVHIAPDNYQILTSAAHYLAANENTAARDGKTALTLATKANDLAGHSQPVVFDVLGMALAETGDYTNAIQCAQNAVALATTAQLPSVTQMQQRLELYQKNQPWRESFRATNTNAFHLSH